MKMANEQDASPVCSSNSDVFQCLRVLSCPVQNQNVNMNALKLSIVTAKWWLLQQNLYSVHCNGLH